MHIKFILPRFHTNMFYPTKILLKHNFKITMDCAYKGFNENYSLIKPKIFEESLVTKFFKIIFSDEFNKMNKFYLPNIKKYLKYFNKNKPDLIIIRPYNSLFFFLILILSILYRKKLLIYNQIEIKQIKKFNYLKKFYYWFLIDLLKIKLISPLFMGKVSSNKYFLFPFVYETSFKRRKRRKFDFLLVGKLYKKKNFELFLKSLSNSNENFRTKLILEISNKEQKKQFKNLLNLIKRYKLTKKVDYSINVKHQKISSYYDNSKCFILATDGDLAPVSIIEALSRGCYVLASDKCGTKNYINTKKNGLIFKTNDVNSLYNCMIKISKIFKKDIKNYEFNEKIFFNKFKRIIKN